MNLILGRMFAVCNEVKQQNEPMNFKRILNLLRKNFKKHGFELTIKSIKSKNLELNEFYIEAYYYHDYDDESPVEVIIYHSFEKDQQFLKGQLRDFLIQVYDAVVHEYKHESQYKNKHTDIIGFISNDYYSYLQDPDEVDAYAFSIAVELLRAMPRRRAIMYMTRMSSLSKLKQNGLLVSPNLHSYVAHFSKTPLLKLLAKKIYKHLDSIDTKLIFK